MPCIPIWYEQYPQTVKSEFLKSLHDIDNIKDYTEVRHALVNRLN